MKETYVDLKLNDKGVIWVVLNLDSPPGSAAVLNPVTYRLTWNFKDLFILPEQQVQFWLV